jgi:hypothetical protein
MLAADLANGAVVFPRGAGGTGWPESRLENNHGSIADLDLSRSNIFCYLLITVRHHLRWCDRSAHDLTLELQ